MIQWGMVEFGDVREKSRPAGGRARERSDGAMELSGGAQGDRDRRDGEGGSRRLDRSLEQAGVGRGLQVENERDSGDARRDLLERFEPLRSDRELEIGEAGDMAARTREVGH